MGFTAGPLPSKTGLKDESVLVHSSAKGIEYLANRPGDELLLTATYPEYCDGDEGCSGGNWSEQVGAVRGSSLRSLSRSRSRSEVSGRESETRPLGQHSESKTPREVWKSSTANGEDTRISSNGTSWHAKRVSALLCSSASFLHKM